MPARSTDRSQKRLPCGYWRSFQLESEHPLEQAIGPGAVRRAALVDCPSANLRPATGSPRPRRHPSRARRGPHHRHSSPGCGPRARAARARSRGSRARPGAATRSGRADRRCSQPQPDADRSAPRACRRPRARARRGAPKPRTEPNWTACVISCSVTQCRQLLAVDLEARGGRAEGSGRRAAGAARRSSPAAACRTGRARAGPEAGQPPTWLRTGRASRRASGVPATPHAAADAGAERSEHRRSSSRFASIPLLARDHLGCASSRSAQAACRRARQKKKIKKKIFFKKFLFCLFS